MDVMLPLLLLLLLCLLFFALYMLPSIVAAIRRHLNANSICVINVFLGWTFVGWVVALAWAFSSHVAPRPKEGEAPIHPFWKK